MPKTRKPVLILDKYRGIYFGYLQSTANDGHTVKLTGARHCCCYPVAEAGHKGVYGLATVGPAAGAKIGPRVTMTVHGVVKIVDCEDAAVERWEKVSW
jgi:hypothetical protein